jgi:transcription initiation factor TFIID subunit TAF12
MFTIQFEAINGAHEMQDFDSNNRTRLASHLATFQRPIMAVYEGSTPITKAMKLQLKAHHGAMSRDARNFAFSSLA